MQKISDKLKDATPEELQKCEESPLYFYNTYCLPEGETPLTQDQYNQLMVEMEIQRNIPNKRSTPSCDPLKYFIR